MTARLLTEYRRTFKPLLQAVEAELQEVSSGQAGALGAYARHVIQAGGKRLRPLLVILCSDIDTPAVQPLIDIATAVELIHTASLIHDDVIDQAATRRDVPTINHLQGNHAAVIAGDFLFATAFRLLERSHCPEVLTLMTNAIRDMCQAELEQQEALFQTTVTENMYLSRIEKKTASLLAACCNAGSLVGGLPPDAAASLADYGRNLGLCFQITDDLLDFTGDSSTLGKPTGSDLAQGILTLPAIYLLSNPAFASVAFPPDQDQPQGMAPRTPATPGSTRSRRTIRDSHSTRPDPPSSQASFAEPRMNAGGFGKEQPRSGQYDQNYIKQVIGNTTALSLTRQKARYFAQEAAACLSDITPKAKRTVLLDLLTQVVQRQY